jgi:hypothetical protein
LLESENATEMTSILEAFSDAAPAALNPVGGTLMLVISEEQKRMLARYGSTTCLDATYKINKWGYAFFMVAVVDEHRHSFPCAYFIVQHERAECVAEALAYLKLLVPGWNPTALITDKDDAEINACKAIFPDAIIILCEFHAKQAWLRWLHTSAHGVPVGEQRLIYDMLNDIMKSASTQMAQEKLNNSCVRAPFVSRSGHVWLSGWSTSNGSQLLVVHSVFRLYA